MSDALDDLDGAAVEAVRRFLRAVEGRDVPAVAACFTPTATYANVPHPPAIGRDGIAELFRPILTRSERVVWEIVTAAASANRVWLERVDRFWIAGRHVWIECNGVYEVDDETGLICALRDYVDLGLWRSRLGTAR